MTKLTKKVALSYAIATLTDSEIKSEFTKDQIVAKLTEMIDGLEKKSGGEKALTEQQKQNINFKDDILALLADGKARTATEIQHEVPTFPAGMSNQRVSQLLRQLWLDGKISKEPVKGKTMFSIVA
jgi:hypothetical protein